MRFNPDIKQTAEALLPDGQYDFRVVYASETTSSNNNSMLVLKLEVSSEKTPTKVITDYVLAKNIRKLKAVAKAAGLIDLFATGDIPAETFVGSQGKVFITTQHSPEYPDKNIVERWVARKG